MPGRFVFILALLGSLCPLAAPAQSRPSLAMGAGPAFFTGPHWPANRYYHDQWATLAASIQLDWPTTLHERLHVLSFVRKGRETRLLTDPVWGYDADWHRPVYQLDFLNLGRWLEPFVGLNASAGYLARSAYDAHSYFYNYYRAPATSRRWTALVGAEIGLKSWLWPQGGPMLTLDVQHALLRYYPTYTFTYTDVYSNPQRPSTREARVQSLRGQAALLIGWHWQLGHTPRQRWRTPRYSEPPADTEVVDAAEAP